MITKKDEQMKKIILMLIPVILILGGCTSKDKVAQILKDDPKIIIEALDKDPALFLDFLEKLTSKARELQAKKRKEKEGEELKKRMTDPLKPLIRKDESIRGTKGAPIVLVEYSDFECPYCSRGYNTVMELLKQYKGKIQFIYKHLPLSFHANATPASKYYEAIRLQSEDKAFKFHDEIYKQQSKLKKGEKFLKKLAKKLGVNMKRLAKDVKSVAVAKRVEEDKKEAAKFGFSGTPGFLLNGIPVKGAYPKSHFDNLIKQLKDMGKLSL